jgi:acyl transferase domain-containing protein
MNTAKLGLLSPTSTCHTFDASADGYGRAEGAGALYLKRLSDAIRDGDPVRGVIRSSAVNSNGKVTGMAITHPSIKGQEMVMRHAYKRAHLNPNDTAYLECHGTGTPVGDPIEVQGASQGMNDTRSKDKPLLLGAIKANIGHSEAASGIFAIMKAAMMTETGVIPGVCGLKNVNPALREKEWNVKIQADTIPWPKDFSYKRASVSSFGYGGTNGHVIIENVDALYPGYSHGKSKGDASYSHSTSRPLLVGFSAHDRTTLIKNINSHAKVADKFFLADLAHTLNNRRTRFPHRAFTVAIEGHEVEAFDINSFKFGVKSKRRPELGFIFTGQGAQWARMGTEAIQEFPLFRKVIRSLDSVLKSSPNPPPWSLEQELIAPAEKSRLSTAEISQPACTAIQIAIVDLFATWNIVPSVTVGHSSGEMAAAYAAGLVSAPEAMLAAYYRGYALMRHAPPGGTMLAVGLGPAEVADMIPDLGNEIQLACENSPSSTTLSGPVVAIEKAKAVLDAKGIFARELRTGQAYHSSYMKAVARPFVEYLTKAFGSLCQEDLGWRRPVTKMISSVTATEIIENEINNHYWAANLTSRVRFSDAVAALGSAPDPGRVNLMVEIGPHLALAEPFKQICKANGFEEFYYVPSLIRNSDCSVSLLKTAGELFLQDYPVDLERVNAVEQIGQSSVKTTEGFQPLTLVDLPPYQWNYERTYWAESRLSREQRQRKQIRHDILGSRFVGLSDRNHTWRNVLRHRDIPWLKDHRLGDSTIMPAAAYIALAAEAVRQICEESSTEIGGVTLRDVDIKTALVVPEVDEGIEIQVRVSPIPKSKGAKLCYAFTVESLSDEVWKLHCAGIITPIIESAGSRNDTSHPFDRSVLTQSIQPKQWYDAFNRVGFKYGPSFQKLGTVKTNNRYHSAAADITVSTESGMMDGESRYILHPSTVDACLQLVIISSHAGLYQEMPWGVVPISIEEISLYFPRNGKKDQGNAVAWTDEIDGRYFNTQVKMVDADDNLVLDIKSVRCVAYEAAVPAQAQVDIIRQPYSAVIWKPDISTLPTLQAIQVCSDLKSESNAIVKMVELIDHKQPLHNILLLGFPSEGTREAIITCIPADVAVTSVGICDLTGIKSMSQDLVIVAKELLQGASFDTILPLIKPVFARKGKLIVSVNGSDQNVVHKGLISSGFAPPSLCFNLLDATVILSSPEPYLNGITVDYGRIMLMATNTKDPKLAELVGFLSEDCDITVNHIKDYNLSSQTSAIILDFDGKLLEDIESETFIGMKELLCSGTPTIWVTVGVQNGTNALGGMSKGLLRSIRAEESNAKLSLLDVDEESSICSIGAAILKKLHYISGTDSGADNEFWLHNGIFYISRIVPNSQLNAQFNFGRKPPQVAVLEPGRSLRGEVADGEFIFAQIERSALGIQEVELQVDCISMEEKTIQASSSAVKLAAGQILKAGGKVMSSLVGQMALVCSSEPFSTLIRTPHTQCVLFSQHDPTLLVATLPSLCRAINALGISQLNSGQHVLLLEPSSSIIKTFMSLCNAIGLTVSVFESVHEFRKFISQNVMPVTVIAHNFSSLSQEVWRYMPSMGRFILNESVIHDTPDALPFTRGASFTSTCLATVHKHDADGLCKLLRKSLELLESHPELLVQDPKVVDISEAGTATESSQVVKYGYSLSGIKVNIQAHGIGLLLTRPPGPALQNRTSLVT